MESGETSKARRPSSAGDRARPSRPSGHPVRDERLAVACRAVDPGTSVLADRKTTVVASPFKSNEYRANLDFEVIFN